MALDIGPWSHGGAAADSTDLACMLAAVGTREFFAYGRGQLFFCGKFDLADIPALGEIVHRGMARVPRCVPPWISDPRSVYALLAVSSFTSRIDIEPTTTFAEQMLESLPCIELRP